MGTSNFLYNHRLDVLDGTLMTMKQLGKSFPIIVKMPSMAYGIKLTSLIGSVILGENTVSTDFESYPRPTQAKIMANI